MSPTLAADMVQSSLTVLLERAQRPSMLPPEEAQGLLASCEIGSVLLNTLWAVSQGSLDRGMESRKLVFLLKEVMDVLDLGNRAFAAALARVSAADFPPQEKEEAVATIERRGQEVGAMRSKLGALLNWLSSPAPKVDLASLPEGRGEREAGGYIGLDELTSRFLSGKGA